MFRAFAKVVNSQNFGLAFLFALSEGDCGPRTPSTTAGYSRLGIPARQHVRSVIVVTLIHLGVAQLERCRILSTHHVCMTSRSSEAPKVPYGLSCEPLRPLCTSNGPLTHFSADIAPFPKRERIGVPTIGSSSIEDGTGIRTCRDRNQGSHGKFSIAPPTRRKLELTTPDTAFHVCPLPSSTVITVNQVLRAVSCQVSI